MIKIQDAIRNELAAGYGVKPEELQYLAGGREDNDGIVYTYTQNGKKYALKIAVKEKDIEVIRATKKLEFAAYLGDCGIDVTYPNRGADGSMFQIKKDDKYIYLASVTNFIDGRSPKTEELDERTVYSWGKLTGKTHAATKKYNLWRNFADNANQLGHEEEIDYFYQCCRNDVVKKHWMELKRQLSGLEVSRDSYGLIHNDNHQNNIMIGRNGITLFDFDGAACQFLLLDIFVPIQGLLFDVTGGFNRPISDMTPIKRFYERFLAGYETENHVEDKWLDQLDLMLNYRRLLLYTVLQGWMESDKNAREGFLNMIENPCGFSIL